MDDSESTVRELTDLILRDYSLTLKLLRTANHYNLSGRKILSVSHAIIMLGTEGVRNLAGSLMIFEHFCKKPTAIRELMMLSMLTANHVRGIAAQIPELRAEEAYLCGMVRNLGEVLIGYYLPGPYARILQRMAERKQTAAAAALEVLQFTFEDIAEAVIDYWGMPQRVAACQHSLISHLPSRDSAEVLLHRAVSLGHNLTTAVYRMDPKAGAEQLKACLREQSEWLPLSRRQIEALLEAAISDTQESFSAMGLDLDHLRLDSQTRNAMEALEQARASSIELETTGPPPRESMERLAKEVFGLLESASEFELNTVIHKVLEAIHCGAGYDRVIFGFLNEEGSSIEGRIGVGMGSDRLVEQFRFRMSINGGPVSLALLLKHPLEGDAEQEEVRAIAQLFGCAHLCLYPVVVARQVVGCIYAENDTPRPRLTADEKQSMEELRNALATALARSKRARSRV